MTGETISGAIEQFEFYRSDYPVACVPPLVVSALYTTLQGWRHCPDSTIEYDGIVAQVGREVNR